MRDKQIKLIYFSLGGSQVRQVSLGWKKIIATLVLSFSILFLIVSGALGLFTNFYSNIKVNSLQKTNGELRKQLASMGQKFQTIEKKIETIEQREDDMRIIVDLPEIDKDTRDVGVGGTGIVNSFNSDYFPDNVTDQALTLSGALDKLERRLELSLTSRKEIEQKYLENNKKFQHTPSIRPIFGGRVTDRFGNRLDPFVQRIRHHDGLDISAPRGTEIFSSADGIVERCRNNFKPHFGYGKEVVIDHGDGIKTRYAHLDRINVKLGEAVSRWDVIGYVGTTGRSTGPHLHYEVIVDEKPANPEQYILD